MPLVSDDVLNRIFLYYYQSEDSIKELNNENYTKRYSLEYKLNERIKSLPT